MITEFRMLGQVWIAVQTENPVQSIILTDTVMQAVPVIFYAAMIIDYAGQTRVHFSWSYKIATWERSLGSVSLSNKIDEHISQIKYKGVTDPLWFTRREYGL